MSEAAPEMLEMGPVDYIVVEYAQHRPTGEAFAELLSLVERGLIRVLDLVFVRKQEDGSVVRLDWHEVADGIPEIEVFEGAASELLGEDDVNEVGIALEADEAAAILVYENVWAAPFASAIRRSGGVLAASGRIPVQDILAQLGIQE
jgi:Family of unknown function (DUF6325)